MVNIRSFRIESSSSSRPSDNPVEHLTSTTICVLYWNVQQDSTKQQAQPRRRAQVETTSLDFASSLAMAKKTVLITGSSSGIGHALAREFNSQGCHVFATARKTSSIADLEKQGIETFALEVTDPDSIQTLRKVIASRTGHAGLDILVNNAGRNYTVPALDVEISEIRSTFETNVFAVMLMCQSFAPLLIEAKGTIVQIGSLAAVVPYVFGSVYNASKGALHSYTDTLRVELAPFGVRVVNIITGGVKSSIARTERQLPRGSVYLPIVDQYDRRQTHSQANAIPAEDYAWSVVRQVLGSRKDTIWEGGKSWQVWFATSFLPKSFMEWMVSRMFQLWRLKESDTKKLN
ncbi:NADPH-dependent 1-acyl dihydroxyacetone phosphate reductase [Elasticomyces elasticus]|nr:NADPH-dependent 1-acyl dihydroxyacetone phosphate reductase [Elasticomyces elasticus]